MNEKRKEEKKKERKKKRKKERNRNIKRKVYTVQVACVFEVTVETKRKKDKEIGCDEMGGIK